MRSCGGNIISGHCTMAGPGWTTHRAQGQLRSTAPAPAPARDQNSFHKLSHHGEYLRLYLYIWARYAVVAAGWVATLRPPVSSSRQIFRSRTLARQRWWCSCRSAASGDTQQFANPRPALQHTAACCPVLTAHSATCPQIYNNRISICINIVTVVSCPLVVRYLKYCKYRLKSV